MSKEKILKPELELVKKDEYYLFYEMLMQTLKTDNVQDNLNKSLYLLRLFLFSGDILLYEKNDRGDYLFKTSDSLTPKSLKKTSEIIKMSSSLLETNTFLDLELNNSDIKNMFLIHLKLDEYDCILSVNNLNKNKRLEPKFWEKVKDTMTIILKRAASYEKNIKAITIDLLTGLNNRNSYEMAIKSLNLGNDKLVFGLFDLFRLKYINDNYSHAIGDSYIKEVAKILKKYWPNYEMIVLEDGTKKSVQTGYNIYSIGGDEFVLLTDKEDLELVRSKALSISEEVGKIVLDNNEELPLGLNSGIVYHKPGDTIKTTFMNADEILSHDKKLMYKKFGLERRTI